MAGRSGLRRIVSIAAAAMAAAAVVKEYRLPPEERTWHGRIVGVPYDFRKPTVARLKERWWNPDEQSLFPPQPFGVGWTINFYRLMHLGTSPNTDGETPEEPRDV
jgi:hypothetical protein